MPNKPPHIVFTQPLPTKGQYKVYSVATSESLGMIKGDNRKGYWEAFDNDGKFLESAERKKQLMDFFREIDKKSRMAEGGGIGFEKLSDKVAKNYEGKKVAPKYQHEYGKTYSRAEAKEVGDKVAGKVYWQQQGRMATGGNIKKYDYSPSIEEQKTWDEKKTRIYDAYANSYNSYQDLLEERKRAIGRNDKYEVKSIDLRLKNKLLAIKYAYSELTGTAFGEDFKDGGNLDSLDARISKAIFQAYGDIDDAIEFKFNDPDSGVAPYRLVFLAVQKGFITPEEINKDLLNRAYETSSETADAEEIGSSDMNYYVWGMLRDAGFDMKVENGTYIRVKNKMAEGGSVEIDVQETVQKIKSEYPRVEVSKTYGGSIQVVDTNVSTLQEINSKVFSGKGSIMKIGGKFSFAHGLYYPPIYKNGGTTDKMDEYIRKNRERQAKEEEGKYFAPYRAFLYEDSYQFADFKTDDFHKAVKWAKETLEAQRTYRKNTESMWAIVDEFTPIEERGNVIYPYKEVARFTEENTKEMKFGNGGNTTFYYDQAKKTLGEHLYNHIASLNKEQLEIHLSHLQKEIERMKANDTEFTKQEFLPKYKQEEKFILYLLERLDEFKYADGGNVEEDQEYYRVFRNNAGKDVAVKILKNPIFGKYDYYVDGSLRGQFDTFAQARQEVNYENFDMYKDGGNIYSKEESLQIARTILQQMGGQNRLVAFTGAYGFAYADGDVSFRIKNRKVNYVKVKLNGKDLYDVTFGRVSGTNFKVVEQLDDVYAEDLIDIFEKSTGMYLRFEKGGKMARGGGIEKIEIGTKIQSSAQIYEVIRKSPFGWVLLAENGDKIVKNDYELKQVLDRGIWKIVSNKMARGGGVGELLPNTFIYNENDKEYKILEIDNDKVLVHPTDYDKRHTRVFSKEGVLEKVQAKKWSFRRKFVPQKKDFVVGDDVFCFGFYGDWEDFILVNLDDLPRLLSTPYRKKGKIVSVQNEIYTVKLNNSDFEFEFRQDKLKSKFTKSKYATEGGGIHGFSKGGAIEEDYIIMYFDDESETGKTYEIGGKKFDNQSDAKDYARSKGYSTEINEFHYGTAYAKGGGVGNINKWEKGDITIVNGEYLKRAEVVPSYKDDTMRGNYFVVFRDKNKKIIESKDNFEAYSDALRYAMENVNKEDKSNKKMARGGEIFNSEFYKDGGSIDINFATDTNYIKRENIKLVNYKNGKELYNWDYWDSTNTPDNHNGFYSGLYVAKKPLPNTEPDKQYSMFKKGGKLPKSEWEKLPKSAFYINRWDIASVIVYDKKLGEEIEIPANRIVNGIWFDNRRTQMIIDRAKKEGLIPDKTKKTTTFIARFNGKKIELEAKSMFDAEQKALKELKVPKSKKGLLSVMSKQAYERGDFQFN